MPHAGMQVLRAVVAVGLLAAALAACSRSESDSLPRPSRAFCQAAYDYDTKLPKLIGKPRQQTQLVQQLADHAPADIAAAANRYLDAMRRVVDGDDSVVDNPKVQQAVENVERRANNGCALYKQDQGGTGGM